MVFMTILSIISLLLSSTLSVKGENEQMLFDFTKDAKTTNWFEQSDSVREVGMSKATLDIQKTQLFRLAVFFTLLNPQPNGAGFAGVRTRTQMNLAKFDSFALSCRGQGQNFHYKIVLRHNNENEEPYVTYEQFFTASKDVETIKLPFSDFKAYYRGKLIPEAEPLDISNITSFGLQMYGGVYSPIKQSGVSALQINWIKASVEAPEALIF